MSEKAFTIEHGELLLLKSNSVAWEGLICLTPHFLFCNLFNNKP